MVSKVNSQMQGQVIKSYKNYTKVEGILKYMKQMAQIFKALSDETRLEILVTLVGREMCVCDIFDIFKLSQPAISHHLKVLKQAGVLVDSRDGKWIYYSVNPEMLELVQGLLQEVIQKATTKERLHHCINDNENNF